MFHYDWPDFVTNVGGPFVTEVQLTRAPLGVGAVVVAREGLVSTCLLAPNIAGILLLH